MMLAFGHPYWLHEIAILSIVAAILGPFIKKWTGLSDLVSWLSVFLGLTLIFYTFTWILGILSERRFRREVQENQKKE